MSYHRREMEYAFWSWWKEGACEAGVRAADIPALRFCKRLVVDGTNAAGVFRNIRQAKGGEVRFRTRIDLLEKYCGVEVPGFSARVYVSDQADTSPRFHMFGRLHIVTLGVQILAHECAHFEQFVWQHPGALNDRTRAEQSACRRSASLVRSWFAQNLRDEGSTYRPPRWARGTEPIRYAGIVWEQDENGDFWGREAA